MSILQLQMVLSLLLVCSSLTVARKHLGLEKLSLRDTKVQFKDLKPQARPTVLFKSEAGVLEAWETGFSAMKDANAVAGRLTLKPGGLVMPSYVNMPAMKIVFQGNLSVGILDRTTRGNVYNLKYGDVVALPEGVSTWWYNTGKQDAIVLSVGDTSANDEPQSAWPYMLAGGKAKTYAGVLQGFSGKYLARAWEMTEDDVKTLLSSQLQTALLKLVRNLTLPDPPVNSTTSFIYHYADALPDVAVPAGGEVRELNSLKMPILKNVRLGAEYWKLAQGAMAAPNWVVNGHQVIYVQSGTGRIQISNNAGERALNVELMNGTLVVVPRFFPSLVVGGVNGLEFVSVVTNDRPILSYLGGSNSVFNGIPTQVLSAAFTVDERMATMLAQTVSEKAIIFPGNVTANVSSVASMHV